MSHAANEFIIRDGVFVRDFEGMYQHVEDPWDQQRNCDLDIHILDLGAQVIIWAPKSKIWDPKS